MDQFPLLETNEFCFRGSLYYGPLNNPRPYSSITEVDPNKIPFTKTTFWILHRGFREIHKEYYGADFTSWENPLPDLIWNNLSITKIKELLNEN